MIQNQKINEIVANQKYVSTIVKVLQLWNTTSNKINQVGLFGDATGIIKFTLWNSTSTEEIFREGVSYKIQSAKLSEWNGKLNLNICQYTKVEAIINTQANLNKFMEVV